MGSDCILSHYFVIDRKRYVDTVEYEASCADLFEIKQGGVGRRVVDFGILETGALRAWGFQPFPH